MDILSIVMLAIAGVFILWSLLAGLSRGLSRGILRLVTVAVAAVGAFLLREKITATLLAIKIAPLDNKNVVEFIQAQLPEELASLSDLLIPILEVLVSIFVFLIAFFALSIVTWIVFAILKLFLPKGRRLKKLIGMALGIVQGAACALIVIVSLTGIVNNVAKLADVEFNGEKPLAAIGDVVDFNAYNEGIVGKTVNKLGAPIWNKVKVVKTSNGKDTDLDAQIDAVVASAKLANEVMAITDINLDGGLSSENIGEIKNLLANLDEIKGEMTPEALEQVNNMISTVAESFELPIDVSALDLTEVNFTNEGNILESVYNYQETGAIEDVGALVNSLADSSLILPLAKEANLEVPLEAEQKAQVAAAIENLPETTDPETINTLKALFAIGE